MMKLISTLLPTLTAKLMFGSAVALGLAFGIMLAVKNGQIHRRDATIERQGGQIVALQRDLGQCRANVSTLQQGIEAQNRAVEAQRAASESRVASLEQSLSTARRTAQTAQSQAAAILARRPGADACVSALELIRGG